MCVIMVLSGLVLNQGNDPVSVLVLGDPAHPPVEGWFISHLNGKGKLSYLERVQLFEVGQLLPRSTTILPFTAQFPSMCGPGKIFFP